MGIIKRGILGGFSNKVGNIVGSSWKGVATMRVLPLSVANPRTQRQVSNRNAFRATTLFASSILTTMIKPLNDRFALRMSGFNLFVQRNKEYFSNPENVQWAKLEISKGRLGQTQIENVDAIGNKQFTIEWDNALENGMQMPSDKAYILAINEFGEVLGTLTSGVTRTDGDATITVDGSYSNIWFYLQFLRDDGTEVGDTSCKMLDE